MMQRNKYKKPYLDKVIVKIDFESEKEIKVDFFNKKFLKVLRQRFPITEEKKLIGREYQIGDDITKTKETIEKEWHYYSQNREKQLIVSQRYISIVYSKYEYFEKLYEDFEAICTCIYDVSPNIRITRLGLRYVNIIKLKEENPLDWDKYLKPELNSIFELKDKRHIARAFHVVDYNFDGEILRFQFGMLNPDYPALIKQKTYTLDLDRYANKIFEREELFDTLRRFHNKNVEFFEEIITDNFREHMEILEYGKSIF